MAKNKSLTELSAGIGDNLIIKKRDPFAPPQTAPARLMEFSGAAQQLQDEITELRVELSKARPGAQLFPLSRLHKVEGRQRLLNEDERKELLENLRTNPLDTPITVVKRLDGDWDIVSGNNRVDIYIELGHEEIEGIEKQYSIQEATRQAFFSNLLHPSLTDFEKYLGFKVLMKQDNKTQDQLAKDIGVTKGLISKIMAFNRLPEEAIKLIERNPSKIGSSAIAEIAQLIESGKKEKGLLAINEIINHGIEQSAAIEKAKKTDKANLPAKPKEINVYKVKSGKAIYADIRAMDKTIRITLNSASDREILAEKIQHLIKEHLGSKETGLKLKPQ